jgi:hypothetical protein
LLEEECLKIKRNVNQAHNQDFVDRNLVRVHKHRLDLDLKQDPLQKDLRHLKEEEEEEDLQKDLRHLKQDRLQEDLKHLRRKNKHNLILKKEEQRGRSIKRN